MLNIISTLFLFDRFLLLFELGYFESIFSSCNSNNIHKSHLTNNKAQHKLNLQFITITQTFQHKMFST